MRLFYLNILLYIVDLAAATIDLIRSRKAFWRDLGKQWYVRGAYLPDSFGVTLFDLQFSSSDDWELAFDFGPFTFAVGRDFTQGNPMDAIA